MVGVTTRIVPGSGLARHSAILLLIGVPTLFLLFTLGQLCHNVWFSEGALLGYQAFLPLGAAALAWHRRHDLKTITTELSTLFPDPDHPKRRGTVALSIFGGLLLLAGVLASLPPLGLIGFLFLAVGIVLALWGPFVLRGLVGPLGFLALMLVPPPMAGITGRLGIEFQLRSTAFTGYVLRALKKDAHIQGSTLMVGGQTPMDIPASFSGLEILLATLAFAFLVVMWHRLKLGPALLIFFTAITLSLIVNIVRVLLLVSTNAPQLLPSAPFTVLACAVLWGGGALLARRAEAPRETLVR
jgi:exosortase/archaeosortase family protein